MKKTKTKAFPGQTKSVYIPRGHNDFYHRALDACAIDLYGPSTLSDKGLHSRFIRALIDAYFTQKGLLNEDGSPNKQQLAALEKSNQSKDRNPITMLFKR